MLEFILESDRTNVSIAKKHSSGKLIYVGTSRERIESVRYNNTKKPCLNYNFYIIQNSQHPYNAYNAQKVTFTFNSFFFSFAHSQSQETPINAQKLDPASNGMHLQPSSSNHPLHTLPCQPTPSASNNKTLQ